MKGFTLRLSTILAVVAFSAVATFAQGTPSSKATAAINTSVACTVKGSTNIGDTIPVDCHDGKKEARSAGTDSQTACRGQYCRCISY